ncbi:MAG: iron-sulfur cluster repair di-iron protein [Pyrinomonadaceae bacterium]
MDQLFEKTVREIALENPATVRIFEDHKIDYCCGGKIKFREACANADVSVEEISAKIEDVLNAKNSVDDFPERKNVRELIAFILDHHHVFTRREIARLAPLMEKVAGKHGARHNQLISLRDYFRVLSNELLAHLHKEEVVLFPFLEKLLRAEENNLSNIPAPPFQTVKNPLRLMCSEHDAAGDILRRMREISDNYALPEQACPSFTALYAGLEDLEKDLHRHIHLENNVLFPKALELEEKISGAAAV